MEKEDQLDHIRFHWEMYVKAGGIDTPLAKDSPIGALKEGGVEHWALFLRYSKHYLAEYSNERSVIEEFIPVKLVKMLVGE